MAARRKSKRSFRRRRASKRTGGISRVVQRVIDRNVENKYLGGNPTFSAGALSGELTNINFTQQGVQGSGRIGTRVKFSSVRFRYKLQQTYANGSSNFTQVRVMWLWSRTALNATLMPLVDAPINPVNMNFKVLFDRTHILTPLSTAGGFDDPRDVVWTSPRTIFKKIGGRSTYPDGGGLLGPNAGYLYFYCVSNSTAPNVPQVTVNYIMSFQDA